ncbi:hypothetical protein [uncultured Empedobacter sp.]|uniref:hypothetical protein n=1 Tax=uncultured Empedobacter sp. TaxID=410844 RepID=UPI0025DCC8EB|nr:hypothetical protein [uncultured Empedobacter sp.]
MSTQELITQLSTISNVNKTLMIIELQQAGYDFTKSVGEQDNQVDEKVAEMLLNSLIPTTEEQEETEPQQEEVIEPQQEEEVVEEVKVSLNIIEPVSSSSNNKEDKRYTQLNDLFNQKKVSPAKRKDRAQLVEQVLDLLIPTSNSSNRKGRILRDKHKRSKVSQLIADSVSKEQLSSDLIDYIDEVKMRASKR